MEKSAFSHYTKRLSNQGLGPVETLIDTKNPVITVLEPTPGGSLLRYSETHRHSILEKLEHSGGVLIRGLFLSTQEELADLNQTLYGNTLPFLGGVSPRKNPNNSSFGVSLVPPNMTIPQHREKNYFPDSPNRASFYCHQPARIGGLTPITDFEAVFSTLQKSAPADIARLLEEDIYFNLTYWNSDYWATKHDITVWGWQERFDCDTESAMNALAESLRVSATHYPAYSLVESHVPLTTLHPTRHTHVIYPFFYHSKRAIPKYYGLNEYQLYYFNLMVNLCEDTHYDILSGRDKPIPMSFIDKYHKAIEQHTCFFHWQAGDCLLLDNDWLGHGRIPFYGNREHWVSLSNTDTGKLTQKTP